MTAGDEPSLAGKIIQAKYKIVSLLGTGGLGRVYLAQQIDLQRSVAVKVLRGDRAGMDLHRFKNEARAASRLNHPNTISVYDFGVTNDGEPFLVMEYLRGRTLRELLSEEPLAIERVVRIGAQVLAALDEAHSCGVVHRDLKSENIIVESRRAGDDLAKVIDFGLAQLDDEAPDADVSGTPEYMAPEQIRGVDIGHHADLYAAGVVLYEMIVGRTPFAGGHIVRTLQSQLLDTPVPPRQVSSGCPPALNDLVMRALAKNPDERFDSASAMRDALLGLDHARPRPLAVTGSGPIAVGQERVDAHGDTMALGSQPLTARLSQPSSLELVDEPSSGRLRRATLDPTVSPTGLVGRAEELARLRDFYRGKELGAAMAIVGPSGIGKARLVREVADEVAEHMPTFFAEPDPTGLRAPWYPILCLLEIFLELPAALDLEELSKAIARIGLPARDLPGLAELLGLPGPLEPLELAVRRRETFASARRALRAISRRHPRAVLCFVDEHEYDRPSREMIDKLAHSLDGSGVRVVVTTVDPAAAPAGAQVVDLGTLSAAHAHQLAVHRAGDEGLIPDAPTLYEITGGNPAAVEQAVGWLIAGGCAPDAPRGLSDLAAARIEALGSEERRMLQAVATHGVFLARAVFDSIAERLGVDGAATARALASAGFATADDYAVVLSSPRISELAAACTPADVACELHAMAFEIYQRERMLTPTAVLAHHADRAGSPDAAYDLLVAAGADAARRFDDEAAIRWFGRAVAAARALLVAGEEGAERRLMNASVRLADVLRFVKKLGLAHNILDEAERSCTARPSPAMTRARGRLHLEGGDEARACGSFRSAIGAALPSGDVDFLCETYLDLAKALAKRGDPDNAVKELSEGIDLLTMGAGLADAPAIGRLWLLALRLAKLHVRARQLEEADKVVADALVNASRSPDAHAVPRLLSLRGRIAERCGDVESALRYRAEAIDLLRGLGDRRSTAELLIASARATSTLEPLELLDAVMGTNPQEALELARTLADEIDWPEGAELTLL